MEVRYEEDIDNSFIGGGISNCITGAGSFVGGGCCNSIISSAVWGVLVGGRCNQINGSASDSAILGGICNTVGGNCSVILGGCNNSIPAAICYAGIYGVGIAAVTDKTFHTNCLNACDTPNDYLASYPIGTIFMAAGGTPPNSLPLYLKCA